MIDRFIDYINKCNEYLEMQISQNQSDELTQIIDKFDSNEELSPEEITVLLRESSNSLEETEVARIPFIMFIVRSNKTLDNSQKSIFSKFEQAIANAKKTVSEKKEYIQTSIDNATKFITINNEIIKKLNNPHFDDFENLSIILDELRGLGIDNISISPDEILDLLAEIIRKNAAYKPEIKQVKPSKVEDTSKPTDEEDEYEEEKIEYNNSVEEITEILAKFGYDFNVFTTERKNYLLKHANVERMKQILATLKKYNIYVQISNEQGRISNSKMQVFSRILVLSSKEFIESVKESCDTVDISIVEYAYHQPCILFPNKVKKIVNEEEYMIYRDAPAKKGRKTLEESTQGAGNNFKENVNWLFENGYDVKNIQKNGCRRALTLNPSILRAKLHIVEDEYGINLKDGNLFSAVLEGPTTSNIDRYIEASEYAQIYIQHGRSKISAASKTYFYQLKYAALKSREAKEINPNDTSYDIIYKGNNDSIMEYSRNQKSFDNPKHREDKRFIITRMSEEEIKKAMEEMGNPIVEDAFKKPQLDGQRVEFMKALEDRINITMDSIKQNIVVQFLDKKYMKNEYLYMIGNTRISRKKVLRIFYSLAKEGYTISINQPDTIKYALAYNSILTQEDVDNINNFRYAYENETGGLKKNG